MMQAVAASVLSTHECCSCAINRASTDFMHPAQSAIYRATTTFMREASKDYWQYTGNYVLRQEEHASIGYSSGTRHRN
jgi:hypothetical protein